MCIGSIDNTDSQSFMLSSNSSLVILHLLFLIILGLFTESLEKDLRAVTVKYWIFI
jgi:hypothetical protein